MLKILVIECDVGYTLTNTSQNIVSLLTLTKTYKYKRVCVDIASRWRFSFPIRWGSLFILWHSYASIRFALTTMVETLALISASSNIWPQCTSLEGSFFVTFHYVHPTNNYRLSEKIFYILCFKFLVALILHYLLGLHNYFWRKHMLN